MAARSGSSHAAHRRSHHLRRGDDRAVLHVGARAGPGGPHRRLAADPPRRNASAATSPPASPAGDGLPVLAALDAVVHLATLDGSRDVPFEQFATGPKRNVLQPGELITGITVPVLDGCQGYSKVGVRNAMVIATASACLAVDIVPTSRSGWRWARSARSSFAAPMPRRSPLGPSTGPAPLSSDAMVDRVRRSAASAARPIDDHRSTAEYRRRRSRCWRGSLLRRAFPEWRVMTTTTRQRLQPRVPLHVNGDDRRGDRCVGGREPAVRAARAARADGQQGRVRAGRVRQLQRAGRRRPGVQLSGARLPARSDRRS